MYILANSFVMWGLMHILFIISPFIFTAILFFATRKSSDKVKQWIGIILSYVAIALLIARNIEIFVKNGFDYEIIPLQICHFANFILLAAFYTKNKTLFALSFCLNVPAAFVAIVFANSLTNYATLMSWRAQAYIWGHVLIVVLVLYAYLINYIAIDKKVLRNTFLSMIGLYVAAHIINNLFALMNMDSNYFYTMRPEAGTPLGIFFTWGTNYTYGKLAINPVYLLSVGVFGAVIVMAFYGLYLLGMPLVKKLNPSKL